MVQGEETFKCRSYEVTLTVDLRMHRDPSCPLDPYCNHHFDDVLLREYDDVMTLNSLNVRAANKHEL
jgi:hypothetical protein